MSQVDEGGHPRKVWVFPIAPKSGLVPAIPLDVISELDQRKTRQARRLTDEEIATKARQSGRVKVGVQAAIIKQHQRSVWVAKPLLIVMILPSRAFFDFPLMKPS